VTLSGGDSDGDVLTFEVEGPPEYGSLSSIELPTPVDGVTSVIEIDP